MQETDNADRMQYLSFSLRGTEYGVGILKVKEILQYEPTRLTCILIVEALVDGAAAVIGILADSVQEVIELQPGDIEATPAFGTQVKVDFILGMGKLGKRFVLLLDIDRVISAEEKDLARE